ncbi:serine/threonine-protein kinase [Streptomyces rubellomurinus]|uniref:Serine/threonine protein kinase n=1 Tax=Streptomyces rubellomurinus (strain ATCC 31215) TaxID=359131 RepID=A0A0F2T7E7_STRR3|nr:serine/threonine-protein kinase [Streptomyces rubellomurinus]KJS58341.1 serine/threonine protein kinase [Streptomyces rubellomurinus]
MTHHPAFRGSDQELLPAGHRVGEWTVTEPIGEGGWATVYAARRAGGTTAAAGPDDTGGAADTVALKVLPTAGLAPRQARQVAEAARRETELARTAPHPRLVRLLDSLTLSAPDHPALDGAVVLVMERARGTLRDLLATGVDEDRGGRIIAGICEGLAHLHRSGWVHTDLKPENVLIGPDGEVRLSDFGLAVELTGTHGHCAPMGTPDYLPPERWKEPLGEHGIKIRSTADIWALGIVIHEVFAAGVPPFPGATPTARGAAAQQYAEGRADLRLAAAVPPFWRALAADCLAPTHAARAPHTAESLLARIRAHQAGHRPRRRRPRPRTALVALAACASAAVTAALWPDPGPAAHPSRVRVFNAERSCQDRADRDPRCSLGLAVDPLRPYTADNVVPTRVWHGDLLDADCQLPAGLPVIDEEDRTSTLWYRVHLPGPTTAWLPAVRTKDRPTLLRCP